MRSKSMQDNYESIVAHVTAILKRAWHQRVSVTRREFAVPQPDSRKVVAQPHWVMNDGGRLAAGFQGHTGDCVARAISIAAELPYEKVYNRLARGNEKQRRGKRSRRTDGMRTAAHGIAVSRKWFRDYMAELGFEWHPTMGIGTGCTVHLCADELPKGRLVASVSKHYVAVVDGVIHDTHDCSRSGTRCVYGYWLKRNLKQRKPKPRLASAA